MEEESFDNGAMCDGKFCSLNSTCARYMMRCDISRCAPDIVFNRREWPFGCPFWVSIPDDRYPAGNPLEDND